MDDHTTDAAGSLQQLEGYLLWQAELATAQRDAAAFADQFPWLTTGEREEVEEAYARERLQVSRLAVTRIAQRCRELRSEYEERYRHLKSRLVALFLGAGAVGAAAVAVLARAWP
ncbi:hypothetical protein [Kitasatospora sp. NPDC051914]|uniref:hypothetical protein n=1 Tax=unclassified Kitasatospora TaxID=2633591 RepID=UPI00342430CD